MDNRVSLLDAAVVPPADKYSLPRLGVGYFIIFTTVFTMLWRLAYIRIFNRSRFPANVSTSASPPRTAVVNGTLTRVYRSLPFRSNFGCGAIRIRRYRSPDCAPPVPCSPPAGSL